MNSLMSLAGINPVIPDIEANEKYQKYLIDHLALLQRDAAYEQQVFMWTLTCNCPLLTDRDFM